MEDYWIQIGVSTGHSAAVVDFSGGLSELLLVINFFVGQEYVCCCFRYLLYDGARACFCWVNKIFLTYSDVVIGYFPSIFCDAKGPPENSLMGVFWLDRCGGVYYTP